jgi:cell division protein FtsA
VAIYTDGGVRFTKEIPIGTDAITNDLAHGLRTSFSQAKLVKERYGSAVRTGKKAMLVTNGHGKSESEPDEDISYICVDGRTERQIQRSALFEFIAPRVEEIFSLVRAEIDNSGMAEQVVAGGAVVTGGGSLMHGMVSAAEKILEIPARHGLPQNLVGLPEILSNPTYATALGLLSLLASPWPLWYLLVSVTVWASGLAFSFPLASSLVLPFPLVSLWASVSSWALA